MKFSGREKANRRCLKHQTEMRQKRKSSDIASKMKWTYLMEAGREKRDDKC